MCGYRKGYFSTQVLGLLILSPIFGTSNPGLYSSIASLTNFIGPGEAAEAAGHSEPLFRVRGAILE